MTTISHSLSARLTAGGRGFLTPIRLPDGEKPGQNSNPEQSSSLRYAGIVQLAPKNLSEVARVTMAVLGSGAKL